MYADERQSNGRVAMSIMYHDGNRQLQDRFESRRIADRLEEKTTRTAFSDGDKAFIESAAFFFIATADAQGRPDCSFKAGMPGFVRVTSACELAFPDYDGNGMFKSLGNLLVNPNIGLLFIAMSDKPKRLRVNGSARVSDTDPLLGETVGAQLIVRVEARAIFPNCPRYIRCRWSRHRSTHRNEIARRRSRPGRVSMILRMPCIHASRLGKVSSTVDPCPLLALSGHA
jgi:uncharacterized protein